jgi:hypothetical protein
VRCVLYLEKTIYFRKRLHSEAAHSEAAAFFYFWYILFLAKKEKDYTAKLRTAKLLLFSLFRK